MNSAQAILNAISMLSLLMVVDDKTVMTIRIFFMIGKQITFVAGNKDFISYKRSFF